VGYFQRIPVVMYHSVGKIIENWAWSFLTVPTHIFENHLKWLKKSGYRTTNLNGLYEYVLNEKILPAKTVVLTFDDGYVDNWTFAAPLLKKYGFTATVVVNPEFVDPRDIVRPTLKDVWGGDTLEDELETEGFMSWPELRILKDSGIIDVQSHAMTHTWYESSDEVVDFHFPGDNYYWLNWNKKTESKPFYLKDREKNHVSWGTPIYNHGKSLEIRRYYPDKSEIQQMIDFVESNGGKDFYIKVDWRKILHSKFSEIRNNNNSQGWYESEKHQLERYKFELLESKRILMEKLGSEVEFFFWPGGGYNEQSMEIAESIYKAVTLNYLNRGDTYNVPGEDPSKIRRFGVPNIEFRGKYHYPSGRYFIKSLDEYRLVFCASLFRKILKGIYLIKIVFKWILNGDEKSEKLNA